MNGTYYNQMPKTNNNPTETRSLVAKIVSSILALLISLSVFLPALASNVSVSYNQYSLSLAGIYELCFKYFSLRGSYSRSYYGSYSSSLVGATEGLIVFIFILITMIFICSVLVLIFSLLGNKKGFKITALLASIGHAVSILSIIIVLLIAVSVSMGSAIIGWGVIIQLLLAIGEIVFTAIALSCSSQQTMVTYGMPQPPIGGVMPIPPVSVPSREPVKEVQPVKHTPNYPSDEGKTIAQFGTLEGLKGDYTSAVIKIMPGEVLSIGRDSKSCNVVIASEKVSRRHCTVEYDALNRCYIVTDLSSNGTLVNHSQQMKKSFPTKLQPGTVLSIGNEENVFRLN